MPTKSDINSSVNLEMDVTMVTTHIEEGSKPQVAGDMKLSNEWQKEDKNITD